MFEKINKEQSLNEWKTIEELKEEEPGSFEEYQEELKELKEITEKLNAGEVDYDNNVSINRQEELIESIKTWRAAEIVYLAYENTGGTFNGNVFIDPDTGKLHDCTWTGNTYLNPELDWIKLYELDSNWINNNNWYVEDIIPEEDYDILVEKYGDDVDFLNPDQLAEIGYDYDTCLMDYLRWCIEE